MRVNETGCRPNRPPKDSKSSSCIGRSILSRTIIPASTWVVVSCLANPAWVVEMETVAAKV